MVKRTNFDFSKGGKQAAEFSVAQRVKFSLISFAYKQIALGLLGQLICGTIIIIGLYDPQYAEKLSLWYGLLLLITFIRYLVLLAFTQSTDPQSRISIWWNLFILGAILGASVWALAATVLFPATNTAQQMLVILVIIGLAAASVPTLSSVYSASLSFISVSLLPLIVNLFFMKNINPLIPVMIGVLLIYLILLIIKSYQILKSAFTLQFENYGLLTDLSAAKSQLELINMKLEQAATHDPLTNVANRNLFVLRFSAAIERAKQSHCIVPLLYMDLDNFKQVNDAYGHHIGDQLLLIMIERLEEILDDLNLVSRLGGDEFTVFFEQIENPYEIAKIAKQICRKMAEPVFIGELELKITISIGIGIYPIDGDDIEKILNVADKAMYYVKQHGGNNFRFNVTLLADNE